MTVYEARQKLIKLQTIGQILSQMTGNQNVELPSMLSLQIMAPLKVTCKMQCDLSINWESINLLNQTGKVLKNLITQPNRWKLSTRGECINYEGEVCACYD